MKIAGLYFLMVILSVAAFAQTQTADEKSLEAVLPSSFGEYELDGLPMTITSKAEGKPYVMASKNYKKGESTFTIIIFDYKQSPEQIKKYISSWSAPEVDDENQTIKRTTVDELPAWQSYDKKKKSAQLSVNVKDRYLVMLSGNNQTVDFLKSVAKNLKLRQLPK